MESHRVTIVPAKNGFRYYPMRIMASLECPVRTCFAILSAFLLLAAAGVAEQPAKPYQYFRVGSVSDVMRPTRPGFALLGGGEDLDEAFRWLCARSGGGDFLVIRATGTDAYNPYVEKLCHENSVATLIIPSRAAADDPFVIRTIREAEAIFIAGGDQANYVNFWKGTGVQSAINEAIRKGVPIGGTSAGLAVQGEYIYSAQHDRPDGPDLSSRAALANPFGTQIVLVHGFLDDPALALTITDSHFVTRDRMGRLLVFLARLTQRRPGIAIHGIGIDERTAVLVDTDGRADVIGHGAAYFLTPDSKPTVLKPGKPLSFPSIRVQKVVPGGRFNLRTLKGGSNAYRLSVEAGVVRSSQPGGKIY